MEILTLLLSHGYAQDIWDRQGLQKTEGFAETRIRVIIFCQRWIIGSRQSEMRFLKNELIKYYLFKSVVEK
jgi:hypothetical protein